jgi:hypothetical protein
MKAIKIYDIEIFKSVEVTMKLMIQRKLWENTFWKLMCGNEDNIIGLSLPLFSVPVKWELIQVSNLWFV